jgi:hypothetical protein
VLPSWPDAEDWGGRSAARESPMTAARLCPHEAAIIYAGAAHPTTPGVCAGCVVLQRRPIP